MNRVLEDLRIVTQSEIFPMIKKVVLVEKIGGFYTSNPRGVFTVLSIHFHLMLALSEPLTRLFLLLS